MEAPSGSIHRSNESTDPHPGAKLCPEEEPLPPIVPNYWDPWGLFQQIERDRILAERRRANPPKPRPVVPYPGRRVVIPRPGSKRLRSASEPRKVIAPEPSSKAKGGDDRASKTGKGSIAVGSTTSGSDDKKPKQSFLALPIRLAAAVLGQKRPSDPPVPAKVDKGESSTVLKLPLRPIAARYSAPPMLTIEARVRPVAGPQVESPSEAEIMEIDGEADGERRATEQEEDRKLKPRGPKSRIALILQGIEDGTL